MKRVYILHKCQEIIIQLLTNYFTILFSANLKLFHILLNKFLKVYEIIPGLIIRITTFHISLSIDLLN